MTYTRDSSKDKAKLEIPFLSLPPTYNSLGIPDSGQIKTLLLVSPEIVSFAVLATAKAEMGNWCPHKVKSGNLLSAKVATSHE